MEQNISDRAHPQVVLVVLDGWGYREDPKDNAICAAQIPCFTSLWNTCPHTLLEASGLAVGLPEGQMGNSEVGHSTIGAGTIIDTDLVRINKSIQDKVFFSIETLRSIFAHVRENNSTLHVMGLIGPGGVHSHSAHLYAILQAAKDANISRVLIHVFTDGRDTPPQSAATYVKELESEMEQMGIGRIASLSGRFYAMDRDNNWERVIRAEQAIFHGEGKETRKEKVSEVLIELYKNNIIDEHIEPIVFSDEDNGTHHIERNDGIIFFNFRPDRARMLSRRITEYGKEKNLYFVTMTEYDEAIPSYVLFSPLRIETTLAEVLSKNGRTQAHIAETEKYAHATYFLNGGKESPHEGEDHILVESRHDILTHDQAPKMRAKEIADAAVAHIEKGFDFIFINFANPDMVGHTGVVPAIVEGIEEVDTQLIRVADAIRKRDGILIITADHGNAELNKDQTTGVVHTAHTTNPVPCILMGKENIVLRSGGGACGSYANYSFSS